MGKTIDNIFSLVKSMKDAATPRKTFGMDDYKSFVQEVHDIDSSRTTNKIAYASELGNVQDEFYKKESSEEFDSKVDIAFYRMKRVKELATESNKYLNKLDLLYDECSSVVFDSKVDISKSNIILSDLNNQYSKVKGIRDSFPNRNVTKMDKIKNAFYFIIDKNKIKKDETESEMKSRVILENQINTVESEIKYQTKILNKHLDKSKKFEKKKKGAEREISKVLDFKLRAESISDFYKKYLDGSVDPIEKINETEKENVFSWNL